MNSIDHIATMGANNYINRHCLEMEHGEKLLTWEQVYKSLLAALMTYRDSTVAQQREALLHASAN